MTKFPVSSSKARELEKRMVALGVKESDWKESFVRSRGPGGQKVNKASTCVMLVHTRSGISVRCEQQRSRALNRFPARKLLLQKIDKERRGNGFRTVRRQSCRR